MSLLLLTSIHRYNTYITWRMLLKLVKNILDTGKIPRQMLLTIVVLVLKGNTGKYRGIGLLEVLWKAIERERESWTKGCR